MPYTPQKNLNRRQALMSALQNTPMNNTGKRTDVGRGLAHMLRQYQAGQMGRQMDTEQAENEQMVVDETNTFGNSMGAFQTGVADQGVGPMRPGEMPTFQTPEVSNRSAAFKEAMMMRDLDQKDAMNLQESKNNAALSRTREGGRAANLELEDEDYLDTDPNSPTYGEQRTRKSIFNPSTGTLTPYDEYQAQVNSPNQSGVSSALTKAAAAVTANQPRPTEFSKGNDDPFKNSKRPQEIASRVGAQKGVNDMLSTMGKSFQQLYSMGGAVSGDQDALTNLKNGIMGTETFNNLQSRISPDAASSIRRTIMATRPLLIGKIIQASDMSAKALDSNRELDFYLSALADPGRDIQSQMSAVVKLNEMMGGGISLGPWAESVTDIQNQLSKEFNQSLDKNKADMSYTMEKYGMSEEDLREKLSQNLSESWQSQMSEEY